ncbi:hypothetical protein MNBD_PLANCTO02-2149 [hydrothermal vent metagenome]|uniref:Uncharacterized protein n=1 Tax=hydrothermal vent metagenome TaxID=652676 RepID=A0A3B1DIZ9_9ZZZZ
MTESSQTCSSNQNINERLVSLLDLHLHKEHGSLYWLQREEQLGINIKDVVRSTDDLPKLGLTNLADLATRSVWDFLPCAFWKKRQSCIVGESGGTTGRPTATVFTEVDFHAAFIAPFLSVVELTDFPIATEWLWVGPSGPHIIGKVVRELTKNLGTPDPWSVDFDPRWVKKTPPNSFAAKRYLAHVIEQVMLLLDRESPEVLFTTPPVLAALAEKLNVERRAMFKGIHYGGMAITAAEINHFKSLYPNAVHLSGYGNSMCGVALEIEDKQRTTIDYYSHGERLIYDVVHLNETDQTEWQSVETGEAGCVMFHRLDESTFLPNVLERDVAMLIEPALITVKPDWTLNGLRNPGPPVNQNNKLKIGLY